MVPIELQHTHIHFDGLGDVFPALHAEVVARKVEGGQHPKGRRYISKGGSEEYSCTYWHLGRKAASMMAPEAPKYLLLKSASVMEVSIVTVLVPAGPLMVSFVSALIMAVQIHARDHVYIDMDQREKKLPMLTYLSEMIVAASVVAIISLHPETSSTCIWSSRRRQLRSQSELQPLRTMMSPLASGEEHAFSSCISVSSLAATPATVQSSTFCSVTA